MRKNTLYFLICAVFVYFCSSFTAYADKHTGKIIPIVKYHPENFTFHLERSFITTSYSNYIEISNDAVQMYLFGTKHTFGSRDAFFKNYIPQKDILEKDSVFIFYLSTPENSASYKGYYPPIYYGEKKDDLIYFYKGNDKKKHSLSELIYSEYGSIENYGEVVAQEIADFVSFNEKTSGINYNIAEEMAVDFLKNDFLFYTSYRTFDKGKAINMFINQLREYVAINNYEEQLLQEFLQNQAYRKKEYNQFNSFKWDHRIFLDKDLTEVLDRVFDTDKVNYCLSNLKKRNYFRYQCYLVLYRKMSQYDAHERDNQVYYYIYPDTNINK